MRLHGLTRSGEIGIEDPFVLNWTKAYCQVWIMDVKVRFSEFRLRCSPRRSSTPCGRWCTWRRRPASRRRRKSVAERTRVPAPYLAKSAARAGAGGARERRSAGVGGGVTLARAPAELTILEVVNAVEPIKRHHDLPARPRRRTAPAVPAAPAGGRGPGGGGGGVRRARRWPRCSPSRRRACRCATCRRGSGCRCTVKRK